jgi:hypothetical protein
MLLILEIAIGVALGLALFYHWRNAVPVVSKILKFTTLAVGSILVMAAMGQLYKSPVPLWVSALAGIVLAAGLVSVGWPYSWWK